MATTEDGEASGSLGALWICGSTAGCGAWAQTKHLHHHLGCFALAWPKAQPFGGAGKAKKRANTPPLLALVGVGVRYRIHEEGMGVVSDLQNRIGLQDHNIFSSVNKVLKKFLTTSCKFCVRIIYV